MGWLLRCGITCAVIACLPTALAIAVGPGDGPGCLGVALAECVGWLRATMTLDEGLLADSLARRNQVDVNGRPLGAGLVVVNGSLPERPEQFVILLRLGPGGIVTRAESNLTIRLTDARTEGDYDRSGLYPIVSRLLGRRCAVVKLDLYRFFENAVKPRIRQEQEDLSKGLWGVHRLVWHAAGVPYCGVSFGYTGLTEWRGSADIRSGRNFREFASVRLE